MRLGSTEQHSTAGRHRIDICENQDWPVTRLLTPRRASIPLNSSAELAGNTRLSLYFCSW